MSFLSSNGGWLMVPNGGTKAARVDLIFKSERYEDDLVKRCLCRDGSSCKLCRLQKLVSGAESKVYHLEEEQAALAMAHEALIDEWNQMVDEQDRTEPTNEAEEWRIRAQEAETVVEEHQETIANLEHMVFKLVNKMKDPQTQPSKKSLQEIDDNEDDDNSNNNGDDSDIGGDDDDSDAEDDDYLEPPVKRHHSSRNPKPRSYGRSTNVSQCGLLNNGDYGLQPSGRATNNSRAQPTVGTSMSTNTTSITATSLTQARQNSPVRGPKAQTWSKAELRALISLVTAHHQQRPGPDGKMPKTLHDMNLFRLMSLQLQQQHGINRSAGACKNEWNRRGRKLSGIDNRKIANPNKMSTSVQ